jgi:hypothetical protein
MRIVAAALISASFLGFAAFAQESLPRQASLGIGIGPSPDGAPQITELAPAGPGAAAGLEPGDLLLSLDGRAITDGPSFLQSVRTLAVGGGTEISVRRGETTLTVPITPFPRPEQALAGRAIEYGQVAMSDGVRIRTFTIPAAGGALSRGGRAPGVFVLQGIPCRSMEAFDDPNATYTRILTPLAEAGFALGMAEKPGVGDSEGLACAQGGFDREVEAFKVALEAFAARPDVDARRIYLVGISLGGVQAPVLAQDVETAGIITWGTVVQPWGDYIVTNFRMRDMISGADPAQAEPLLRATRIVMTAMLTMGQTPDEVRSSHPEAVAQFDEAYGQDALVNFGGRHFSFHQEIDRVDSFGAWAAFGGRLMAVQGEHDWVGSEHDHRLAVDIVNVRRPGAAEFVVLPGEDHLFTRHENRAASFANTFQGERSDAFHQLTAQTLTRWAQED